jgi:hypothetical protein
MSGYTAVILVSDGKKNIGVDAANAAQESPYHRQSRWLEILNRSKL